MKKKKYGKIVRIVVAEHYEILKNVNVVRKKQPLLMVLKSFYIYFVSYCVFGVVELIIVNCFVVFDAKYEK